MKKEKVVGKSSIYFLLPFNAIWAFWYRSQHTGEKLLLTIFFPFFCEIFESVFDFIFKDNFPLVVSSVMGLDAQFLT